MGLPSLIAPAVLSIFFCFLSIFARMRLEAALIFGASVYLLPSSFASSTAFCYRYLLFSSNFFCSSKNFNSRSFYSSSAAFCSSVIWGTVVLAGVTSTIATLGTRFFLVINLGANVQPYSSFSSRSALAYYSRFSYRRRLSSMSIYTRLKSTFFSLSAAKL